MSDSNDGGIARGSEKNPFTKTLPAAGGKDARNIFAEPDVSRRSAIERITEKREKFQLYSSDSHRMKSMFMSSASLRSADPNDPNPNEVNPLWIDFPTKCVRTLRSEAELREKLDYFAHSDDVMVVQYHQANCTACNAVSRVHEFLCHQSAQRLPNLRFYEVSKEATPALAKGLVRFPQVKAYSGGQWEDIDFKPPTEFREELYGEIEKEMNRRKARGEPVTALQAEEMYFSAAGPAMKIIYQENLEAFYRRAQVRMHNYWKQVSVRRTWFYKKYIEPEVDQDVVDEYRARSIFGERVVYGPTMPDDFAGNA